MSWIVAAEAAKQLNIENVGRNTLIRIVKQNGLDQNPEYSCCIKRVMKKHKVEYGGKVESPVYLFNELTLDFIKEFIMKKYPNGVRYNEMKIRISWED